MIRLGLRLARAGGPVRLASLLLGAALSVAILGLAWGLPDALYPIYPDPYMPGEWITPIERGSTIAMSTLMLAPVLLLLIATGRLSSTIRDQRLVSLRLIGVSKARTLVAAVAENVSVSLVGALAGAGLFHVGAWVVNGRLPVEQPLALSVAQQAVLVVAVVALAGLLALTSLRTLQLLPTQARRGGLAKPASWWRIVPVILAVVALGMLAGAPVGRLDDNAEVALFLMGVVSAAIGVVTAPALVSRYSASMLRRSRRPAATMAGRAIEAEPTSSTRRVAAVGVGILALAITASVMSAWESATHMRMAAQQYEHGPQKLWMAGWEEATGERVEVTQEALAAAAAAPGTEWVIPRYDVRMVGCDRDDWDDVTCGEVFVGTCEQLETYLVLARCSDSSAAWISDEGRYLWSSEPTDLPAVVGLPAETVESGEGDEYEARFVASEDTRDVEVADEPLVVDWEATLAARVYGPDFVLFVPIGLLADVLPPLMGADVIGPGGREYQQTVSAAVAGYGLRADQPYSGDYEQLLTIRTMLGGFGAAMVSVIVLVVMLSILDWLRESRRPRMKLLAVGVPRGVIARSYLVQFGIPLLGAVALGSLLGVLGYRAYESMGRVIGGTEMAFTVPATYWWLALGLVAGVLAAAGLAGIAARERMRPADLRRE